MKFCVFILLVCVGEVGLPKVDKKPTTRPISPNLTRPRPPLIPGQVDTNVGLIE